MNSLFGIIKEKPWIQAVIGIQILLFVILLTYAFWPKLTFRFPGSAIAVPEWSSYAQNAHPTDQDSLEIAVSEAGEEDIVGELPIRLPKRGGAYHITIQYEQIGRSRPAFDEAQCYLDIYGADSHFLFDRQKLYDNAAVSEGIVWAMPYLAEVDAHFYLINKGAGDIVIHSVDLKESSLFCVGLIVLYLMTCGIFWLLVWSVHRSSAKDQIVLLVLAAILFACSYPLFTRGVYDTKDLLFHLKRIGNLAESIMSGDWHAWYEADVANGHGYVEQIFYPQFLIHLPALLYLLDIPLYVSYKIYLLILNVLTIGVAYWSFQRIFSLRIYGLLSTALYSLAIYRFLNLFGMNALGELSAKIFLPLLCYGLWKVFKEEKPSAEFRDYLPLMISGIGLVFSHVLTCELLLIYVPLFLLLNLRTCISLTSVKRLIQSVLVVFLCGFGFIIPFLHGLSVLRMDVNKFEPWDISVFSLTIMELFNNVILEKDSAKTAGVVTLIAIGLWILWCICKKSQKIETDRTHKLMRSIFIMLLLSLWGCTDLFPWPFVLLLPARVAAALGAMQFPWRLLTFVTLFDALLISYTLKRLIENALPLWIYEKRTIQFASITAASLLIALCIGQSFGIAGNYLQKTDRIHPMYLTNEINNALALHDYTPVGVHSNEYDIAEYTMSDDSIHLLDANTESGIRKYTIRNDGADGFVEIPVFSYSLMRTDTLKWTEGDKGRMCLLVPEGFDGDCSVWFEVPVFWHISQYVSILSFLCLGIWYYVQKRRAL